MIWGKDDLGQGGFGVRMIWGPQIIAPKLGAMMIWGKGVYY